MRVDKGVPKDKHTKWYFNDLVVLENYLKMRSLKGVELPNFYD